MSQATGCSQIQQLIYFILILIFIFIYFLLYFLYIKNVKRRRQNVCPAATQDTKDTSLRGLNCLLLFGVKSLYLFVVKSNLFHHSKIVPLVYAAQVHLHLISDTSRTILVVKLKKICQ